EHCDGFHLATGFNHQIAARPIGIGNSLVGGDFDALTTDHDMIGLGAGFLTPTAMHRVEVNQVGMSRGVTSRIVDLYELKLWPAPGCTQGKTPDTTETVDTYFDAHALFS